MSDSGSSAKSSTITIDRSDLPLAGAVASNPVTTEVLENTVTVPPPAPAPTLARGATVGRYLVLEKLGGGGMGVVYTAFDPELDRKIAIKLLRSGSGAQTTDGHTRLLREAQALARLSHPNVITVHDVGTFEDQVFVAMELVEGMTLAAWIAAQTRSWTEIRDAYLQAGRGLAAAHGVGIVHRDFKPDNVIVAKDGRVRVLDFGLARAAGVASSRADDATPIASAETQAASPSPALATPLTRAGSFMGTPAYSSPEQLQGEPADAPSDQFSFCVALYEALYGERPFAGDDLRALLYSVILGEVRPAPAGSRVPARLRAILLRGLLRRPEDRHPSMEALLAELARDPSRARRRAVMIGGAAIAIASSAYAWHGRSDAAALCGGASARLSGAWDPVTRATTARAFAATGKPFAADTFERTARMLDDYAHAWVRMETESCEATRITGTQSEELLDLRGFCLTKHLASVRATTELLAHADAQIVLGATTIVQRLPALDDCADVDQLRGVVRPPKDPAMRGKVVELEKRIAAARALAEADKSKDAEKLLPSADEARQLHYPPIEAKLSYTRGWLLHRVNETPKSVEALTDSVLISEATGDLELLAAAWLELIDANIDQRHLPEARLAGRHVQSLVDRMGGHERLQARLFWELAWVDVYDEKPGEPYLERALAIQQRVLPPDDPELIDTLENQATMLASKHRLEEALAMQQRLLALREARYGANHPLVAWSLYAVGSTQARMARYDDALRSLTRSLAIYSGLDADREGHYRYTLLALARVEARLRRFDDAIVHAKRAVTSVEMASQHTPDHTSVATSSTLLATILRLAHREREALEQSERGLAILDKESPPTSTILVDTLSEVALDRLALGRAEEALPIAERAVKIVDAYTGGWNRDQPDVARFTLARALRALGRDRERARALAEKARDGWVAFGVAWADERAEAEAWLAAKP